MVGVFVGNDPTDMRELAGRMSHHGEHLSQLGHRVSSHLRHTSWCGDDADATRYQWDSSYLRALLAAADALRLGGEGLVEQARQQEDVSRVDNGVQWGPYCRPFPPPGTDWHLQFPSWLTAIHEGLIGPPGSWAQLLIDGLAIPFRPIGALGIGIGVYNLFTDVVEQDWNGAAYNAVGLALGVGSMLYPPLILASMAWTGLSLVGLDDEAGAFVLHNGPALLAMTNPVLAPFAMTYLAVQGVSELVPAVGTAVGDMVEVVGDAGAALAEGVSVAAGDLMDGVQEAGGILVNGATETASNLWNSLF